MTGSRPRLAAAALLTAVVVTACLGQETRPSGVHLPPGGHNLAPPASNQWFSNILTDFPTQPVFPLPGAFQLSPAGLAVSVPAVTRSADSVQAPFRSDLVVGTGEPLGRPQVRGIGDWSVDLAMSTASNHSLRFTLAHGVPYTSVRKSGGGDLMVTCQAACSMYAENTNRMAPGSVTARAISVVAGTQSYILATDQSRSLEVTGNTVRFPGADRLFVGLLDDRSHFGIFRNAAGTEVLETRAEPRVTPGEVRTTYTVRTSGPSLLAIFPHQARYMAEPPSVLGSYETVRGRLQLTSTRSFTTAIKAVPPPLGFAPLASVPGDLRSALASDVDAYLSSSPPASQDYFFGVWLGRGVDLLQVAQASGRADLARRIADFLEPKLEAGLAFFHYDPRMASVIANSPEFGNEKLNDHHFHYGYYIRAAAVLGAADAAYLARVRPHVRQLVDDIATADRGSARFPYLRNFDPYEGHSWADGFARFADGNNQESSSEAVNAWYAVYLWAEATQDAALSATGRYLLATEVAAAKEYWFGAGRAHGAPYRHQIASIVWGGKYDFHTWFSDRPNAIYGIQLLPLTPASGYLGELGGFESYRADVEASGGSMSGYWGDLLVAWESFYSPKQALAEISRVSDADLHGPRSVLMYLVHRNAGE